MKLALSIPGFSNIDSEMINETPVPLLPEGVPTGGLPTGLDAIFVFINLILIIAVLLALFNIGMGGLNIIQSKGNKEKFASGRSRVLYAVFGLAMIFISFFMLNILSSLFGVDLLPFGFIR